MAGRRREWLLMLLACVVFAGAILRGNHPPIYDQIWLLSTTVEDGMPPFESGMASRGLAVIVKSVVDGDAAAQNSAARAVAAVLVISGVGLAVIAAGASFAVWTVCFSALLTTGIPVLWVTPDVLACAAIGFLFAGAWQRWPMAAVLLSGLVLSFSRPDLLIPGSALTVGAILSCTAGLRAATYVLTFVLAAVLLIIASYTSTVPGVQRATRSFGQHYALLLYGDQDPTAFDNWQPYRDADFGPDATWREAVRQRPDRYREFVWRSTMRSLSALGQSTAAVVAIIAAWAAWRRRREPLVLGSVAFVLTSAATIVLLSFAHERYFLRFVTIGVLVVARAAGQKPSMSRGFRGGVLATLAALALWQAIRLPEFLSTGHFYND